ncbi:DUF1643 domain-containing protein [Bacillus marinisedimentorum]|uniref:DUF1643 domain-containing protein n=1 Tax=Bacillus marinisedimentorum TaxID=1821260 RepID=UPI000872A95A|nr:DUF1643 domain-containing protein [Bacillus marinisedimentorum]
MKEFPLEYPSLVLKEKIKSEGDDHYRYALNIPLSDQPKNKVVVIMKNPSVASHTNGDQTANRVINYCHRKGFDYITIVNLFAYRTPDAKTLKTKAGEIDIIGPENDSHIHRAIEDADTVILAWGNYPAGLKAKYDNRVRNILQLIEGKNLFYIDKISNKGIYPLHGMVWGYKMEMLPFIPEKMGV